MPRYKRLWELRKKFGLTLEDFMELGEGQNWKCKICGEKHVAAVEGVRHSPRLQIDHNHKSNKIRGLLCRRCNVVLGQVNDDIGLLAKMVTYLVKSGKG